MNEEELKAGERYNFVLLYTGQSISNKFRFESPTGIHYILGLGDLEAISPVSAPKYDPCRRFRKGDEVEYLPKDGREFFEAERLLTQTLTVVEDEHEKYNRVEVEAQNGDVYSVPFYYLKLVTPVEELEPYRVETGGYNKFRIKKGNLEYSYFPFGEHCVLSMDEAKAAAEAECARLNEEYRKECNNA